MEKYRGFSTQQLSRQHGIQGRSSRASYLSKVGPGQHVTWQICAMHYIWLYIAVSEVDIAVHLQLWIEHQQHCTPGKFHLYSCFSFKNARAW